MQHVKTLRRQLGVSQKDFAALMGCSTGQLAMAEAGLRKLPVSGAANILLQPKPATARAAKSIAQPSTGKAVLAALKKIGKAASVKLGRQQLLAESLEKAIAAADNMQAFAAACQQQKTLPELTRMQLEVLRRKAGEKKARYQLRLLKCQLQTAGLEAMITTAATLQKQW